MNNSTDKQYYDSRLFDLTNYTFERASLGSDWDSFIDKSPHGSIYSLSSFLSALETPLSLWKCYKKKQLVGQIVTGETQDGTSTCKLPHVIYSGIIGAAAEKNANPAQAFSENFRLTSAALIHLTDVYTRVEFAMCPQFEDMRPFLWFNYNTKLPKFKLDLRYTSFVSLKE